MRTIVAADGGGSKTLCILADENGTVLGKVMTGSTNHQLCGINQASTTLCDAIDTLLENAGVANEDVASVYVGLSGMDFDRDVELMRRHLRGRIEKLAPVILNDLWIALAAAETEGYGAISICGTGHNTGVATKDGTNYGISALRFALGNFGGGLMLAEYALHKAFRSYEKTGEYSALQERLPGICDASDMQDLMFKIYESKYTYHLPYEIPRLVDALAREGDAVCCQLLAKFGQEMGEMTGRLIRISGLEKEQVPIVLAGSLHIKLLTNYMLDAFYASLKEYCRDPILTPLSRPPVLGAALLAQRKLHGELNGLDAASLLAKMDETLENFPEEVVGT